MDEIRNKKKLDRQNMTFFDRWASTYDSGRITSWFQYTQKLTIKCLNLKKRDRVLDVGCGTGFAVVLLGSMLKDGHAYGIDISHQMIEQAKAKTPCELKNRVEFKQASSDSMPFEDKYFDHIICTNSFHHYPDPQKVLKEMQRVLVAGGQVVIFENAPDLSLYTKVWDFLLRLYEKGHVRYYRSDELGKMIRQAGYLDVQLYHLRNEFLKYGKLYASIQVWGGKKP